MAVLIVIPVLITVFIIYRRWLHPLAQFPGPFVASISGLYQTYWNFQPNFPDNFVRLHEKYGRTALSAFFCLSGGVDASYDSE